MGEPVMRGKTREEQAKEQKIPRDPAQRRFDRTFALTFIAAMVIVIAVLGFVLPKMQERRQPSPENSKQAAKAEVEKAYLAYWDAIEQAYLKLDASPLQRVMTPGALEVEHKAIEKERLEGGPRRELATRHDYQIAVYKEGDIASVDDVYELERAHLDPQTLEPVETEASLTFHGSFVMRRVEGIWKIDDEVLFGTSRPTPEADVSQAAISFKSPVSETLLSEIEAAYLAYWTASTQAYQRLDPTPLHRVTVGAALERDLAFLNEQHEKNQRFLIDVEHNYRIALSGSELVYVYDTVIDRSKFVDSVTGKLIGSERADIFRFSYFLKKVEGRWKIGFAKQYE
jgi:hypothetical protein